MRTDARVSFAGVAGVAAVSVALSGVASTSGCSSQSPGFGQDGNGATGSGSASGDDDSGDANGDDGSSRGGGSGAIFSGGESDAGTGGPSAFDAACATSTQKGEQQALDAYLMLDYSGSMLGPKWDGVTAAIRSFVMQPTTGISVGLQYFGLKDANADAGAFSLGFGDSCDPAVYAHPEIEIAPLPGVGSKINASLASHTLPITGTPTKAALQGAIDHASAWAKSHASDVAIAILATDGEPSECGSLQDVQNVASAGVAATPKILTFVIGVGSDLTSLNAIAQAGGTGSAFIVDTSKDISMQFLQALNKIRGAALGCQYAIPVPAGGGVVDTSKVNVQFTPPGASALVLPHVSDKSKCPSSGNAWYYDKSPPSQITLCTTTCGTVSAGGTLNILTGCQTVEQPTK